MPQKNRPNCLNPSPNKSMNSFEDGEGVYIYF